MATPRGITQPHTSFIGSACQGIHHTPVTKHTDTQTNRYKHQNTKKKDTRVHYTVLTQHNPHTQPTTTTWPIHARAQQEQHCAAPDTQQCTNAYQTFCHATVHPPNPNTTRHNPTQPATPPSRRRNQRPTGVSPPGNFNTWQSHTRRHQPHKLGPQLQAHKNKSSLERR